MTELPDLHNHQTYDQLFLDSKKSGGTFYRPQNLTTKNFVDGLNGRRVCDVTCRFPLSRSEAQNQTTMLVVLLPLAKNQPRLCIIGILVTVLQNVHETTHIELFTDITYLQRKELQQAHAECLNDTVRP